MGLQEITWKENLVTVIRFGFIRLLGSGMLLILCCLGMLRAQSPGGSGIREDYDGDGRASSGDVVAMLQLAMANRHNPRCDYNEDGAWSIMDALALTINIRRGRTSSYDPSQYTWSTVGFGGGGGLFRPTIDPHDPTHALIACDMTGGYVTFDDAQSWQMFNLRTALNDYEFDPTVPGRAYALNSGLYRTDNGGRSWRLIFPTESELIEEKMTGDHADHWFYSTWGDMLPEWTNHKVLADPADPEHIVFARRAPWQGNIWLMGSHNGGSSWTKMVEIPNEEVLALYPGAWWGAGDEIAVATVNHLFRFNESTGALDTLDLPVAGVVWATGGRHAQDSGYSFYILSSSALYRSTDGGLSWNSAGGGGFPAGGNFNLVEASLNNAEAVYLACNGVSGTGQYGVLKTLDSGANWSWVYRVSGNTVDRGNYSGSWLDGTYGPSWRGSAIGLGVSPVDPDLCYASDYGSAYRTTDGGANWTEVYAENMPDGSVRSRGLNVTGSYGVIFDPFDSGRILLPTTDVGMFASSNGGESWIHSVNGIPGNWRNTSYWAAFDPDVEGKVWSVWSNCHDLPREKMFSSGKLEQNGYEGGVAVSGNSGASWTISSSGIPANTVCTHILIDPTSPTTSRTLYVCGFGRGVYKSTNGGGSWTAVNNGLGANHYAWRMVRVPDGTLYLLVARGLVAGSRIDGELYRSSDGAASWQKVILPEGYNAPNDLVYDQDEPGRMYLSCWPTEVRSVEPWTEVRGGVLRTEDGGGSWEQVFDESAHVYAGAVDPNNSAVVVINTFNNGAFRSEDRGESWYRLEGYNFKWGYRPFFDPHQPGMIYLTTFGGGIFYGPDRGEPGALEDIENDQGFRWQNYNGEANLVPGL